MIYIHDKNKFFQILDKKLLKVCSLDNIFLKKSYPIYFLNQMLL